MKVEVGKFGDGRSLKVLVRFESSSKFWVEGTIWVPKMDEVNDILEVLSAEIFRLVKREKRHDLSPRAFLGDRVSELETLAVGGFLYDYGSVTKRIRVPKFEAKREATSLYQDVACQQWSVSA